MANFTIGNGPSYELNINGSLNVTGPMGALTELAISSDPSAWTSQSGYYTSTVSMSGVTSSTLLLMAGPSYTSTLSTNKLIDKSLGKIWKIDTGSNIITIYAHEIPEVSFSAYLYGGQSYPLSQS